MVALKQRLRELSKEAFENLIHQLLIKKFPGAGIKKSDGTGGDQGVDSFSGSLSDGPAIWQCKHFPDRIRKTQRKQILESAKIAFKFHRPKQWTLCVPIDFRTEEHRWFEAEVIGHYGGPASVALMSASEILEELYYNRPLRDAFFESNSISDALRIRQIALGTEGKSLQQKEQLTVEYAQQFLEGNVDLEPRLQPVVSVGLSRTSNGTAMETGAIFSVRRGLLAVAYIPRDPITYNLDPISVQMRLGRAHSNRLQKSIDTGRPSRFPAGAILKLDSESPLLRHFFQTEHLDQMEMEIRPGVPAALAGREHPMRLLAGCPPKTAELSYVPFRVAHFGRKEITLISCSRLPMEISMKLKTPPRLDTSINMRPLIPGADATDLANVLDFLDVLEQTGKLEISSIDPPGPLFGGAARSSNRLKIEQGLKKAISETALIAKHFGVRLCIPETITKEDLQKIRTLIQIATGEFLSRTEVSGTLVKDSTYKDNATTFLGGHPTTIRMENPSGWEKIELFGHNINCGRVSLIAENVVVSDGDALQRYLEAPNGEAIAWTGICGGKCWFVSEKDDESDSKA